ncbi:TPA: isopentenyl-diphosphate Delta-isomerase [Klebsiella pneumoniae]|nr:isopentenyl-diphosphate Delta-isomerase [Klebsiella pneumoniae]
MAGEHVILLDEQDQPAGMLEKYAAHTFDTPLHLAFSCWLFNQQGQLLVTRRSLGKKAWPGVWTNSVCGHPQQGETFEQAVTRRCRFELGVEISDIAPVDLATMLSALAATPWAFSPWMVLEAENRDARQALTDFVARLRG